MAARAGHRAAFGVILAIVALGAAFVLESTAGDWRSPEIVELRRPAGRAVEGELRVLALNLAKCDAFGSSGLSGDAKLRERLERVGDWLAAQSCDLVMLSEVVFDCPTHSWDQARYLAEQGGFSSFVRGENYRFGLPGLSIRSGNALLSRLALRRARVEPLAGPSSLIDPTGRRRALWCEVELSPGEWIAVASLRNDSFDLDNNLAQTREILARCGQAPALLAGDFNAQPNDASIALLGADGRWQGTDAWAATYPSRAPARQIDYVLAPADWTRIERRVLDSTVSDHLAVFTRFAR